MAIAPTMNSGIGALIQSVNQGSPKLSSNNTNLQAIGITTDAQAQALNQAYNSLVGVGTNDGTLQQAAGAAIYQPLDGYTAGTVNQGSGLATVALAGQPVPAGFNLSPDKLSSDAFNSWSTGYQRQYIDKWMTSGSTFATSAQQGVDYKIAGGYIQIGTNAPADTSQTPPVPASPPINVVITPSQDSSGKPLYSGGDIYVIESLTKTSFAPMSSATQALIANYDASMPPVPGATLGAFATIATAIAVNKVGSTIVDPKTARTQEINEINKAIAFVVNNARNSGIPITLTPDTDASRAALLVPGGLVNADPSGTGSGVLISGITTSGDPTTNPKGDGRLLCFNDVSVFVNELVSLQNKLLNMSVFSADSILPQINAITTRYTNLSAFGNIPNQISVAASGQTDASGNANTVVPLITNVVSTDVANTKPQVVATYYAYQVQPYTDNTTFTSTYNGYIQQQTQAYNNSPAAANGRDIHADDWVLVDGGGNLVKVNTAINGITTPKAISTGSEVSPWVWYPAHNHAISSGPTKSNTQGLNLVNPVGQLYPTSVLELDVYGPPATQPGTTNQTTIGNGYQKLIQAERQINALQSQMDLVVSNDPTSKSKINGGKALDLPNLIFLLQLYTNLIDEQQNSAATELVNQQNDLLNTYSQMQAMVNAVQGKFDASKQTEQRDIFGNIQTSNTGGTTFYSAFTPDTLLNGIPQNNNPNVTSLLPATQGQLSILSMFDTNLGKTANPIETINNINRVSSGLTGLFDDGPGGTFKAIARTATAWNSYGTTLSSLVTQINQQTQLQMNNIDTLNKEKDQHFNLANNCLSKLNDLLSAIGRNLN